MGFLRPTPEERAARVAKLGEREAKRLEKRAASLVKARANIRALAEREFLRSRINLGVIKLDERQTLYLAMIFQELAMMNDRAAAAAGEEIETDDADVDEKLAAEVDKLSN